MTLEGDLKARGETTNNLIVNLFKACKSVPDKTFVRCILNKEEKHEEGETVTSHLLMKMADIKFKILKQKSCPKQPISESNLLHFDLAVKEVC